jgi:xanthine/CO dehydrogenase XdhC/CoxF family maturation factor
MSEWLPEIDAWRKNGKQVAVATVTKVEGSAPRPVGARLAVSEDGEMAGSVSGGCVENAVVQEAQEVLKTGTPKLLRYGITNEMAWDVGLACGGTIEVFVEPTEGEA